MTQGLGGRNLMFSEPIFSAVQCKQAVLYLRVWWMGWMHGQGRVWALFPEGLGMAGRTECNPFRKTAWVSHTHTISLSLSLLTNRRACEVWSLHWWWVLSSTRPIPSLLSRDKTWHVSSMDIKICHPGKAEWRFLYNKAPELPHSKRDF